MFLSGKLTPPTTARCARSDLILLSNLQLRQIQATDVDGKYQFGDYFGLRLICTGVALLAIAMITLTAGYRWETSLAILAACRRNNLEY